MSRVPFSLGLPAPLEERGYKHAAPGQKYPSHLALHWPSGGLCGEEGQREAEEKVKESQARRGGWRLEAAKVRRKQRQTWLGLAHSALGSPTLPLKECYASLANF